MSTLLSQAYDPEEFKKNGHQLVDDIANYLARTISGPSLPVLPPAGPETMYKYWHKAFGQEEFDYLEFCKTVIGQSIHLHHPHYIGHQVVPPVPLAALTEMLAALLNNGMAIYEMGPAATAIERVVIEWLAQHLGMESNSGGVLTSGGSAGNLTGLLAARQAMCAHNVWGEGVLSGQKLAVMVSGEAHYSIARAAQIMGWGEQGVVKIPVNVNLQADTTQLEACLAKARFEGLQVIAIVANACSTSTGAYDDLQAMASFAMQHRLWFHVDGAHGAAAIFSDKYRHLVHGIGQADSVVIDFHKMLLTPALTTAVMFKNAEHTYETFAQKAEYLLANGSQKPWYDGAARSLECTKKMMGIKVYALIKQYSRQLFSDFVTRQFDLARDFASLIRNEQGFELAVEPQSNIVCFRYRPARLSKSINAFTAEIRTTLLQDAGFYVVQTSINGDTYLRTTLMNPFTTISHLQELLLLIRHKAAKIVHQSRG